MGLLSCHEAMRQAAVLREAHLHDLTVTRSCCCVGCRAVCCAAEADYVAETGPTDAKCLSRRWWYNHLVSSE